MTIDIEIRKALKKDVKKVAGLAKEAGVYTPRFRASECVIAIRGENLIGIARLRTYKKQKMHELSSVTVKDGWRNCGIGRLLLAKIFKQAKFDIYLSTIIPDYYGRAGFVMVDKRPKILMRNGVWCKGCNKKSCATMVKKVTSN